MTDLPKDFLNRMKDTLGDEFPEFLSVYEREPYRGFRVNVSKLSPDEFFGLCGREVEPVEWCENGFYFDADSPISGKDPRFCAGLYYIQEPSAMSAAGLLDVRRGDRILDLCAAPGGKSTQIAEKLCGSGLLVSNEYSSKRAAVLRENIERLGFSNVIVTNCPVAELEKRWVGEFDKILVDAPCSGEGMFRKETAAVREWSVEHTEACAVRQRKILDSTAKMLSGGGILVYSTCTFAPRENEELTDAFLRENPDFELIKSIRIYPHLQKGEGHFAAALRKRGEISRKAKKAVCTAPPTEFSEFVNENLTNFDFEGDYTKFGGRLFLMPENAPDIEKIKVLSAGLYLGAIKKNRFEPSHALCHALRADDFKRTVDFGADSLEIQKYLRGETLSAHGENGFCAVLADGFPLGWGKTVDGIIKNHYPKNLRFF